MTSCRDDYPACEVARRLDCSLAWLQRCRRALGDRMTALSQVDTQGNWLISAAGVRLLEELVNLRRGMGMPLGEALRQVRDFDPEKGLYRSQEAGTVEWRRRYETVRDEVLFLREHLEKSEERTRREREMMALERHGMLWERYRKDLIIWQLGRALQAAATRRLPGPAPRQSRLLALLEKERGRQRRIGSTRDDEARVSWWDRVFRPERMRKNAA